MSSKSKSKSKAKSKAKSTKSENPLDAVINVNVKKTVVDESGSDRDQSASGSEEELVEVCENCGADGECYSDCGEFDYVKVCEACGQEKCKPDCEYYGLPDESTDDVEEEACDYCGAGPGEDCASDCEGGSASGSEDESGESEDEACEACGAGPDEDCYSDCDCEECESVESDDV